MVSDWKAKASAKRQAILDSIPQKWRIESVPDAKEQKDVTGAYIQQFLSQKEIEITETDAVGIAKQTASGVWSAVEVAEAFCHRASLAHQLVRIIICPDHPPPNIALGLLPARDIL
jgi:amidase